MLIIFLIVIFGIIAAEMILKRLEKKNASKRKRSRVSASVRQSKKWHYYGRA